jgi:hypothetical protein
LQRGRKTPAFTEAEKRPAFLQRVSLCTRHVEKRTAETPGSTAKNALKNDSKIVGGVSQETRFEKRVGNIFERFWGRVQRLGLSGRHTLRRKTAPLQKR